MTPKQIRQALEAGIITPAQSKAMLSGRVDKAPVAMIGEEDNMRFLRSFSDVFIGLGLIILMLGLSGVTSLMGGQVLFLGAAAIAALMANYFGRVKRAHFPTLVLALFFLFFVQKGLTALIGGGGSLAALVTVIAMSLFYWRIRLPFCTALIALSLLYLLFSLLGQMAPGILRAHFGWVLVASGLAIFSVALVYDTQDTHRRTRFADNAFWLHFIAAPLIIHGLVIATIKTKADVLFGFIPTVYISRIDAAWLLVIVFLITLVGLAINRRALIVSSFGYAIFALAYLFDGLGVEIGMSIMGAFLALGAAIVFLGVGWHATRNVMIRCLPKWKVFPPPYEEPTSK